MELSTCQPIIMHGACIRTPRTMYNELFSQLEVSLKFKPNTRPGASLKALTYSSP